TRAYRSGWRPKGEAARPRTRPRFRAPDGSPTRSRGPGRAATAPCHRAAPTKVQKGGNRWEGNMTGSRHPERPVTHLKPGNGRGLIAGVVLAPLALAGPAFGQADTLALGEAAPGGEEAGFRVAEGVH